jgi:hypothetical protein
MREKNYNSGLRGTLFEATHYQRMGAAVWLFGWLVLRQTGKRGGLGLVLGGRPISYREIEEETNFPRKTIERWLRLLRVAGYIETKPAPLGLVIHILKEKKFSQARRGNARGAGASEGMGQISTGAVNSTAGGGAFLRGPVLKVEDRAPQNCARISANEMKNEGSIAWINRNTSSHTYKQPQPPVYSSSREGATNRKMHECTGAQRPRARPFDWRSQREAELRRELAVGAGPTGRK